MSASIDDVLSFRAPNGSPTSVLPPQLAILVLDTLEAPADFLFVHLLSRAFKQGRHCCLVGVNRDKEYYNTVLKKHVRLKGVACLVSTGRSRRRSLESAGSSTANPSQSWHRPVH